MRNTVLFACFILLSACFRDDEPTLKTGSDHTVLVLNEGNFQWGNASITRFDIEKGEVIAKGLFQQTNGFPLGDVLQSVARVDDLLYFVINNSGKIQVCRADDYRFQYTLSGFRSPRYLTQLNSKPNKALISDLYLDSVSVMDLDSRTIEKRIYCPGWTERMLSYQGWCYVSNKQSESIYCIDELTLEVEDSLSLSLGSFDFAIDGQRKLWVACKGDEVDGIPGGLHQVDPKTNSLIKSYPFDRPIAAYAYHPGWNLHFVISDGLYAFDPTSEKFELWGDLGTQRILYAVAANDDKLFVADAKDYIQNGEVFILNNKGQTTGQFTAGKIPGEFYFEN